MNSHKLNIDESNVEYSSEGFFPNIWKHVYVFEYIYSRTPL